MLSVTVREGAVYYGKPRRRLSVELDDALRLETEKIILTIHDMILRKYIPPAKYEKKCNSCSLYDYCMPGLSDKRVDNYIRGLYQADEKTP